MIPGEPSRVGQQPGAPAPRGALAALIGLFFLLMLPNLDNSYPYQGDETFYTISALNMIDRGDYLAPFYEGEHRFNKPILTYWVAAGAYRLLGAAMWSARVPILLLACLTLFTMHRFALFTLGDGRKALLAAAMLASSPMFFSFSRVAMTEMVLISCTVPAVFMFSRMMSDPVCARRFAAAGTALVGLAFMAKGPVGLLPFVAALAHAVLHGRDDRRRLLSALLSPLNLAIIAAIVAPWYIHVAHAYPGAFTGDLGVESRTLGKHVLAGIPKRLLQYAAAAAIFVAPFSIAGAALAAVGRTRWNPSCAVVVTAIVTHVATFILFVGVYKSRYLLPAIPLLCILLADLPPVTRWRRWLAVAGAIVALQAAFYALAPSFTGEPLRDLTRLWKRDHAAAGTLGIALDAKRAGWCRLYAGNRGLAPTAAAADFLIVEDTDLPRYAGWEVVATATRRTKPRLTGGRVSVTEQAFHLLRRHEL